MTEFWIFAYAGVWLLSGLCGSILIWIDDKRFDQRLSGKKPVWCPTPKAIFGMILGSFIGLSSLSAGIALLATAGPRKKKSTWWNSPICKQKDNDNA